VQHQANLANSHESALASFVIQKAKLTASKADTEKSIVSVDYYQEINSHKAQKGPFICVRYSAFQGE